MIFPKERVKSITIKNMVNKRYHRGVCDVLGYLMLIDSSTVLHKDGAISRHFRFIAPDSDASSDEGLDYIAGTWHQACQFLGDGWMIETNVLSQPFEGYPKPRQFPDIVSALIDDERRLQYEGCDYFKNTNVLSLTYKPNTVMASKLSRFSVDGVDNTDEFSNQLDHFNRQVNEYLGFLSRALTSVSVLEGAELVSFLYQCLHGDECKVQSPFKGAFLDCYLANADFVGGFEPMMGKKHIRVLAIDDLPASSYPTILESLNYYPLSYRWSSRFIALNPSTASQYLKRYEKNWSSKAIGLIGVLREAMGGNPKRDVAAQSVADQLRDAQIESGTGETHYGFYNSVLVLMHEEATVLESQCADVIAAIQKLNFKVRLESVNATDAFLGSLPSHGDYNLRKMMVDSYYLAHALPTTGIYQGEFSAPCPKAGYRGHPPLIHTTTRGSRPFLLNLHVGDVGHTAILGPTGKGKTTLNGMLMASHRQYPGSRIIVLDKDRSNQVVVNALGGDYVDIGEGGCQFNPLARLATNDAQTIDVALEWVSLCCGVQGVDVRAAERQDIREALIRLAGEPLEYKNLNHLSFQNAAVREGINAFNKGHYKQLLNGERNSFADVDVLGIEMGDVLSHDLLKMNSPLAVIKAIFNELEVLFKDERPTLLILEEAWMYLKHPVFRDKLTDWFKTLRKFNVAVLFVSQDIDDIAKSECASVIQNACMTRIFLPNSMANEGLVKKQYEAFGLTEPEINIIQQAIPKQDYYYASEKGRRLFSLDLQPLAQSFLCVSERVDRREFQRLFDKNNPDSVADWLRYKGLNDWAGYVVKQYGLSEALNE